ncbi:hypothetical protein LCI18_013522 [Fusarium solani-melongenae]|uniref:Uncharacterized protein n=1 Tax=Fusarium solani subsp. cucurbitae TaxID=2747967 RepID=A0ACD3ZN21_FUSSC|nr:hypothetical protein LCI18_013522 [Fusarium solani-melongenae]
MLHQPRPLIHTPQQADHGLREVTDLLDKSVAICRRVTAWSEARASLDSPVAILLDKHTKCLQDAVCSLRTKLLNANLGPRDDVPVDVVAQLPIVRAQLFKVLNLVEMHARYPATGQDGGLNALFASKFILGNDTGACSAFPSLGPDVSQRIMTGFSRLLQTMGVGQAQSISQDEAIRLLKKKSNEINAFFSEIAARLDPRYVHTYQKMEDVPYNHDFSSSISKGSFALVRKVKCRRTHEVLAMKTFFKESDRVQILREIGILEVCDHPNILKLVEAFTVATEDEDDTINIVMRPWAPFTLQKFLESPEEKRRAQCPWFQPGSPQSDLCIYRIMQQLADAVAYLHGLSIKHKDIKPDNILLHEPGSIPPRAIVADVGVSKVLVHNGSTKYDDCSYPYLAPEQVKKRDSSLRADVWQLGCCFALLLAVSKTGTEGYRRLWMSFSRSGEDCSCQIAGEHGHFMKSFIDICSPSSWADRAAYSLVANMLDPVHETRIGIKEVLASVGALLCQARKDGTDDVVMTE